jgi:hypothetical protein
MPLAAIEIYLERIPKILAERRVEAAMAGNLPWIFAHPDQRYRDWVDEAYADEIVSQSASPGMLKLMGIGVQYVV